MLTLVELGKICIEKNFGSKTLGDASGSKERNGISYVSMVRFLIDTLITNAL